MNKYTKNFATPDWDSTSYGEEMCKNLFKGNERVISNKLKKKKSRMDKIQKSGKGEKSKTGKKQILLKDKMIKNVGKSFMKARKLVSGNREVSKISLVKVSHGGPLERNSTQKMKELPNPKQLAYSVRNKLKRNGDTEMKTCLLSNNDSSMSVVDPLKTTHAQTKHKQKRKKLKTLKKHIKHTVETDIREGTMKSKTLRGASSNFSRAAEYIQKKSKPLQNSQLDDVFLLENRGKISKKNKKCMSLRERMMEKLKASRFRYLNQEIYTMNSQDAQKMFTDDPESFKAYHEGYRLQVNSWPINPVDVIISKIKTMPKSYVIADFGCGDAKLSEEVHQKVHSFDLVATNERVTACDMANVPLKKNSVDVVVFCLSLMGINIHDYLKEANRILKVGGLLKIAEVESRFDDVDNFIEGVRHFGYQNTSKDLSHDLFHFLDFKKTSNIKKNKSLPTLSLHPCLYKKR